MTIIIFTIVVLVLTALALYAVDQLVGPPTNPLIKVLIIIVAILLIAHKAGLL